MSGISAPHQWARSELQDALPGVFKRLGLTSRIAIPGGHLSLAGFNSDATIYWEFGPVRRTPEGELDASSGPMTWGRSIGNQIACEARFPGTEIQLRIDGGSTQTVTLRPPSRGDVVEVRIANAELEDVALTPDRRPWTDPFLPSCDVQDVYPLTTAWDKKPWPVPIPDPEVGPREKPCPGMALSGWQSPREESQ
jgi:hypothetical protein